MHRAYRHIGAALAVAVVAAACGPRFDVSELEGSTTGTQTVEVPLAGDQAPVAGGADGDTAAPATGGQGAGPAGDTPAADQPTTGQPATGGESSGNQDVVAEGSQGTAGGGTGTGGAGAGDAPAQDDGGGAEQPAAVDPGPAPGVTDEPCPGEDDKPVNEDLGCIKIGVLVPESGAAPVPSDFRSGVSLYWYEKAEDGGTHGRQVELFVRDTTSQPTTASTRARELLQEGVFTIVSLDRLEVHKAIADVMEAAGVPHVMVQSTTPIPSSWTNTFVISIDHTRQGRAVARYWADDLGAGDGARPVGFVREQTSALKPGTDALEQEGAKLGLDIVAKETIDPSQTSFTSTVLNVCGSGAEIVWLYMAPTPALTFMQQAASQNCNPIWFANSISWNLDLAQGNPAAPADSRAFSPWVSLTSDRASEYRAAYQEHNGREADDLGLAAWGLAEVIDAALESVGPALGRDSFRRAMANLKVDSFDVWNPVDCTGGPPYDCATAVAVYEDAGTAWDWTGAFRTFQ